MSKQTDLLVSLQQDKSQAIAIFTGEKLDNFLKEIEDDALNFVADVTTDMGRKQIASKSYSVSQNKVKINDNEPPIDEDILYEDFDADRTKCSICGAIINDEVEYGGEGIEHDEVYCKRCYQSDSE